MGDGNHRGAAPGINPERCNMNWLLEPSTPDELVENIDMHTLAVAIFAVIQSRPQTRVTWLRNGQRATRVMMAAMPAQGDIQ